MLPSRALILAIVMLAFGLRGQNGTSYSFNNPPPDKLTAGSALVVGDTGTTTYSYWIVAKYPGGDAAPYGPITVTTARPLNQMGTFRYVSLSWTSQPLATGYDVLRSTISTTPTGACACVISAAQTATTLLDTGLATIAYTVSPAAGIYGQIYMDSLNAATPKFKQNLNGTVSDIGTSSNTLAAGLDISITTDVGGTQTVASTESPTFTTLTDGATVTFDAAGKKVANATVTLGGTRSLVVTGLRSGGSYVLRVLQDGTGSRGLTLSTGCTWKVSGGGAGAITPTTTASASDVLAFTYDGTNCYANFNKNFN